MKINSYDFFLFQNFWNDLLNKTLTWGLVLYEQVSNERNGDIVWGHVRLKHRIL